ncbi:FMN-dependent NADH-azoreductase [Brevibacillus sp. H7]|uniref:FMN-dependent NADH-azoreductase n=1 Tax=Brevibacillus sp. H7 TaxID=3349138 RepID=UPI0037F892A4
MSKLLVINANPKTSVEQSFSLQVADTFIHTYRAQNPNDTIETINVYRDNVPTVDDVVLSAWGKLAAGESLTEEEKTKVSRMGEILQQFKSADKYVIVLPLFNWNIPSRLKDYIDNVLIARETFRYTEAGTIEGLLGGRKAAVIQGSGGVYSEGPTADVEFSHHYLKFVLATMGITDYTIIRAEGTSFLDKDAVLDKAKIQAEEVAAKF